MTIEELAALLKETGRHHHQAFISADGADPEWALWYAGFIQTKLWDSLGELPTRSSLVHLLIEAEKRFHQSGSTDWPAFYAEYMVGELKG